MAFLLYYEWTCQELVAVVVERGPLPGVGLAGGGSGGGGCGLAVAGVGLPLDACGVEHRGYNYLHRPLGLRECVVGDEGGDECPHANEVGVQATRTGVRGYCGWPLPCGCGLGGVLTGD